MRSERQQAGGGWVRSGGCAARHPAAQVAPSSPTRTTRLASCCCMEYASRSRKYPPKSVHPPTSVQIRKRSQGKFVVESGNGTLLGVVTVLVVLPTHGRPQGYPNLIRGEHTSSWELHCVLRIRYMYTAWCLRCVNCYMMTQCQLPYNHQ